MQQANYTIDLARSEGEPLATLLAPEFLDRVAKARDVVAMDKVGAPTQPLADEGRARLDALIAADGNQELSRSSGLPALVSSTDLSRRGLLTNQD